LSVDKVLRQARLEVGCLCGIVQLLDGEIFASGDSGSQLSVIRASHSWQYAGNSAEYPQLGLVLG
jgi:hypothetical protein